MPTDAAASTAAHVVTEQRNGVKLTISRPGFMKVGRVGRDIEENGLPAHVQQNLKVIREWRRQIAQLKAELRAVMADQNLSTEAKHAKVGALHASLAVLNGALASALAALSKAMDKTTLSPEQAIQSSMLVMKDYTSNGREAVAA